MIKVCQLCNAIYAPITYIFSSVVLHQKWLKLPLPVESRLKKKIVKKVEQSALERCERVKELFSRVSHPAEKSKKEDLSLSAGFCFRSNSENVFISRMNSSRKKLISKSTLNYGKNPRNSTQRWKLNLNQISLKFTQNMKALKILGIDLKKIFESVWAGWELKRGLINITWSYISKCHVCGSRKKVFPRSSHLSTRTTRSRFFRNSVECGNCTLVDVV